MPKIKTHRAAAKRFKKTATGKLRSYHAFSSHKFESKTAKRKRRLRGTFILSPGDMARLRSLLPYKA
ncbi:MAG: 50S ribosomal protein L35 [Desulforudis sp.]|nr:50S ribosomal protein L35 [Clostridia bacterium]MDQ7792374.1 50S ribosomal protein L35 [Clostridia bacterium]RJX16688.1 MAG: 50S ribosomal protein L35 [Desulforudis sp.]